MKLKRIFQIGKFEVHCQKVIRLDIYIDEKESSFACLFFTYFLIFAPNIHQFGKEHPYTAELSTTTFQSEKSVRDSQQVTVGIETE